MQFYSNFVIELYIPNWKTSPTSGAAAPGRPAGERLKSSPAMPLIPPPPEKFLGTLLLRRSTKHYLNISIALD